MAEVWLDLEYSPVTDSAGTPVGELVTFNEITDQVLAEKALARPEESLSFALSASGMVGVWDWDIEADVVTSDANFARMFGVNPARALAGTPIANFIEGVHPDDRELLSTRIAESLETGQEFRIEYRLRNSEDSVGWVLAFGRPALTLQANLSGCRVLRSTSQPKGARDRNPGKRGEISRNRQHLAPDGLVDIAGWIPRLLQ